MDLQHSDGESILRQVDKLWIRFRLQSEVIIVIIPCHYWQQRWWPWSFCLVDQCQDFPFRTSSSVNRWQIQCFSHKCYLEPGSAYNWMAPELMRREAVAEEVDVYGFFVTMWEFFTGNIPWRNHDWKAIFNKVWNLVLQLEFCVTTGILCYNWNLALLGPSVVT